MDAITTSPHNGKDYFVEPHVERMSLKRFFARMDSRSDQRKDSKTLPLSPGLTTRDVVYLQSQNGNIYSGSTSSGPLGEGSQPTEIERMQDCVPRDIDWASQVFGSPADAVNIWIGDERSVTSVHSDPYENIYTVLRGQKQFILFPPTEGWCLKERAYPRAVCTRDDHQSANPSGTSLQFTPITESEGPESIRWSSTRLDFSDPSLDPPHSAPIRITVKTGETLYLPVGWWHHVSQLTDSDGFDSANQSLTQNAGGCGYPTRGRCVALNWWYDTEMRGMNWVWLSFLRDLAFKAGPDEDCTGDTYEGKP